MAKILQKWLSIRYLLMAKKFGTDTFNFEDAEKFLKRHFEDSTPIISLVLSEFKRSGWLNVEIDPTDSRKRRYSLIMMYNKDAFNQLVIEAKVETEKKKEIG